MQSQAGRRPRTQEELVETIVAERVRSETAALRAELDSLKASLSSHPPTALDEAVGHRRPKYTEAWSHEPRAGRAAMSRCAAGLPGRMSAIGEWLESIGLERYEHVFHHHEIFDIETLMELKEAERGFF